MKKSLFTTIRTEGAILPAELLQRIINTDSTLDGLKPTDYHFSPGERLNEAATRSWNRLSGVWKTYKDLINRLPEDAIGTTETRERWLFPLFQELGYGRILAQKAIEIEGKSYPISHKATEPVAIHLVSYKWDLDRRNTVAKGETKLSPHSLVQEFLNRSKEHLWGFLSNGLKLRILRDNISLTRAAYVEFDLQAMMDGDAYSDFFLLYLLCHQSRVEAATDETGRALTPESCWLEKWYNTSITEGVRALDELRNNVQAAIESLGAGFISYPQNAALRAKLRDGTLTLQTYYTQVLRQVYRLLFVFVAEDRDLLLPQATPDSVKKVFHDFYSTYRIRELARKKRGTGHCDLWHQLKLLFSSLYSGNAALGLPALGSFLFRDDSTPDLADCGIANSDLLSAIRYLCYTQKNNLFQPVNYRNLGPEELGSVYESLLEMHPDINLDAGYFKLNIVAGSQRKTTGSYYTPSSLVNCLLDSALEPVIANALTPSPSPKKGEGNNMPPSPNLGEGSGVRANPASPNSTSPEQSLLALKICDPACGSGHFLIAAAHRLAKRLAAIRAGEDEPAPSIIQHALRDVIGHCIYGVDINPMSVELCKISLWMEALEPGKPLAFLDHHIQCGNSLLGCTPALLKKGIPDAAFSPITGDEKEYCSIYKKQNKEENQGDALDIFSRDEQPWEHLGNHAPYVINLNKMDDNDLEGLLRKEAAYAELLHSTGYLNSKFIYDAWCAAFVWKKAKDDNLPYPVTQQILDRIEQNPYSCPPWMRNEIMRLATEYQFLHWHIAFPDVFFPEPPLTTHPIPLTAPGWSGGFDCILGNPPWERVKLQEKEFFAARDESIAHASNASVRTKMIESLPATNPALFNLFLAEKRRSEGSSRFIREGGFFPLCGRGDLNTYTVFAELNRILLSAKGNTGCIVPSGIATDDTTKFFFQDLFDTGSLISLYDFENKERLFPGVHSSLKFCLLTMRSSTSTSGNLTTSPSRHAADFVFFAHNIADLSDSERHFQLSAMDIALINPNTRTCPIFRCKQDAELTKYIYRRVPVLINENDPVNGNPWGISFNRMFDMSNDSHLFKTKQQLEDMGFYLQGNHFIPVAQDADPAVQHKPTSQNNDVYLPLYEAKMIHHFNHRFGDYADLPEGSDSTQLPYIPVSRLQDPYYEPLPRYWVKQDYCFDALKSHGSAKWLWGWRDFTNSTNARTTIPCICPRLGTSDTFLLLFSNSNESMLAFLLACLSAFVFDYTVRQKIGGVHLKYHYFKQLPVLRPDDFNSELLSQLTPLILELIYTSYSLQPFARDCGYDGPPFIWDEERRFEIRCELDALFFHLYLGTQADWVGMQDSEIASLPDSSTSPLTTHNSLLTQYLPTPRHAVDYIMETFPIVKRKDLRDYGTYRTKLRILELYDQMTYCLAPKTEYRSALNPPPGPLCDSEGNFIPIKKWDMNNCPKHIHLIESTLSVQDTALEVVWPPLFPDSGAEKAVCTAFLSIMSQKQVASDSELLETLILAVNPNLCNALLDDDDAVSLESVIMKAPQDLFNSPSHTVYWKQTLKLFEELEAIEIDRNQSTFVIRVGVTFEEICQRYSISSDIAKYALKAHRRFEEIKNDTQAKQQEVEAVDSVVTIMQRESSVA